MSSAEPSAQISANRELVEQFAAGFDFELDDFQIAACGHVAAGRGVLVAAPTGSGKTVVGEFACWLALQTTRKCFYTTPIKALSNQKYHDLCAKYGAHRVGLITGDQTINSEAPVVVMTTEVLRNMIYARSSTLQGLGYVVMDEVHYLADRFRGAVWEEVILGLAADVQLVSLSATVSNAEEFGEWLDEVRGDVPVVLSEKRPVPLFQHVMVGTELVETFADDQHGRKVNPKLLAVARAEAREMRDDARRPRGRSGKGKRDASGKFGGATSQRYLDRRGDQGDRKKTLTPSRAQVVRALQKANLLPAIIFIFSRSGCDGAVRQLLGAGVDLTTPDERVQLLEIAERHAVGLSDEDKQALGWPTFIEALGRGIAAHHAGLLPAFKAIVEEGFVRGLLKVVYATETLALGINMPARTVVIEKLVKYNGESHVDVTPGEFTQLTGRAGRRGIDVEGHAVVLWQPGMDPRAVASLASTRTYPLRSSFAPNYNMAVNLVQSIGREAARSLLEQSFAQFQADRRIVAQAHRSQADIARVAELWDQASCERGDFHEYAQLREEIHQLESEAARLRRQDRRAEVIDSLLGIDPGDVIYIPAGKHAGWAAVIETGRPPFPNPLVMTESRQIVRLTEADFPTPTRTISRVRVPKKFDVRSAADRKQLANALSSRLANIDTSYQAPDPARDKIVAAEIDRLRAQLRAHPCHSCPDRESHARLAEEAIRLERTATAGREKTRARANSIANQFDRVCAVLDALGYLDGDQATDSGRMLSRIYNELDLVLCECIQRGILDGLDVGQLAAVLSTLVYESRGGDVGVMHRMPDRPSEAAQSQVRATWREVGLIERDNRVERGPAPDIGFAETAYQWAEGASLADVLESSELPAGDFVRWTRQVIELAAQISLAPGTDLIRRTAKGVVVSMRRDLADFRPEMPDEDELLSDLTQDHGDGAGFQVQSAEVNVKRSVGLGPPEAKNGE